MEIKTRWAQDRSGNVLPFAQVALYYQGTDDLVSGLEDKDGSPLENPFQADVNGKAVFAAPDGQYDIEFNAGPRKSRAAIQFLDGGYKFRFLTGDRNSLASDVPKGIKVGDSVNITQYSEVAPVCPATWELVADDAALPGGAVAGDVTGAAAGCLYVANGDGYFKFDISVTTVHPQMLGAHADGISDVSPALNAAFAYLGGRGGGQIYFQAGTYLCRSTVNGKAHVSLAGDGWGAIIKRGSGVGQELINFKDDQAVGITVFNLSVDLNAHNDFYNGIHFDAPSSPGQGPVNVSGCKFFNSNEAGSENWTLCGVICRGINDVLITGNMFLNTQCKAAGPGGASRVTVENNISYESRAHGISCVVSNNNTLEDVSICGNTVVNPVRSCIFVGEDGGVKTGVTMGRVTISGNRCSHGDRLVSDNQVLQLTPGDADPGDFVVTNNILKGYAGTYSTESIIRGRAGRYTFQGNTYLGYSKQECITIPVMSGRETVANIIGEAFRILNNGTQSGAIQIDNAAVSIEECEFNGGSGSDGSRTYLTNCRGTFSNNRLIDVKGVGLFLRVNSGGECNIVSQNNRCMDTSGEFQSFANVDDGNQGTITLVLAGNDFRQRSAGVLESSNGTVIAYRNIGWVTENFGNASVSPDANGNATIAHGLIRAPSSVSLGLRGDNANSVQLQSVDSTNMTVRIRDASGADVTSGSFTVDWQAMVGPTLYT